MKTETAISYQGKGYKDRSEQCFTDVSFVLSEFLPKHRD